MPHSWIALNSVKGLGPVRLKHLLEQFGTPENVFRESARNLQMLIPESCAEQIKNPEIFKYADKQIELANKLSINILTISSKSYPYYLKEILDPPVVLYYKGDLSAFLGHAVAIVGSRSPTQYGKFVTKQICKELCDQNLVIVSGLARGIDTIAHSTCVENKKVTIAVLGSGLDQIHPSSNHGLAKKIEEFKGIVISEFPLGVPAEPYNFPKRNRVISGLAAGVVVVEAGEKSGSLITANYAVNQGRKIFAVPGPTTSPLSAGTFNLLRNGATPARNGAEIAENLKLITNTACLSPLKFQLSADILNEEEKTVFQQLSAMPIRIDEISEKTGILMNRLYTILLELELKGFIKQISGQQYISLTSEKIS